MLSPQQRSVALRQVPAFSGLDDNALGALQVCLRWREFAAGQRLYRQGEAGDSLALVAAGALSVTVSIQSGEPYELARVSAGGMVGEMVCVDPAPRSATVAAVEPTVIAELSRDGLTGLRSGAPKVYAAVMRAVIQVVGSRLREMNRRIDDEQGGAEAESAPGRPTLDRVSVVGRPTLDRVSVAERPTLDRVSVSRPSVDKVSMGRPSRSGAEESPKKRDGFRGLIDKLLG
jgi:CRP-like cAMP-binding protein